MHRLALRSVALLALTSACVDSGPGVEPPPGLIVEVSRILGAGADAIAVRDGTILAMGARSDMQELAGPETEVLRFDGALALPGFEDSHIHLLSGGLGLFEVDLFDAESLDAIQRSLLAFVSDSPGDENSWVLGRGWRYTALPEGRPPTRNDIDAVVADRPVFLVAYDGHSGWANTRALELAGVTSETTLDGFGEIVRDPTGRPTGMLKESAMRLVREHLPPPSRDRKLEALERAMNRLASLGTVAIQNASGDEEELGLYRELERRGASKLRVAMAMSVNEETTDADIARIAELAESTKGSSSLRVTGVKIVLDGVIESHTAAMLEPYADVDDGDRGAPVYSQEALDDLVGRCARAGLQVWIHAIGDRAVRMALDAFEKSDRGPEARFRIEHIEVVHPDDVPRFRELGVIAAMQPIHAYPSTVGVWSRAVGEARLEKAFAWHSLDSAGAHLVFGTDWPASISVSPLRGIHNAVNRRTLEGEPRDGFVPDERVSLATAIESFTSEGAYAAFAERRRGRLEEGLAADFVILDRDIFDADPMAIADARVLLTVVGGKIVYRAKGGSS